MGDISRARLAAFLQARARQSGSLNGFSLDTLCAGNAPQGRFGRSRARRKMARTGRRAGKTTVDAGILLEAAVTPPFANQGFITLSLKNAKRLVWPTLKRLNTEYDLGGEPNEEGTLRFPHLPNQPNIYLGGLKDKGELEKIRGWEGGVKTFILDEAQSIRTSMIEEFVEDAAEPALFDWDGQLIVTGTPGPVCAGYFHDIDVGKLRGDWDHHHWTLLSNPWLERKSGKASQQLLDEIRARHGWDLDNPTFRREYMGEWVQDLDALVFRYMAALNDFQELPAGQMTYVIGVDLGFDDADAIAVLGWLPYSKIVYLVEEYTQPKQGMTALMHAVQARVDKYRPIRVVMDLGGLAKKAVEDFRPRFALQLEAADKHRKLEHIEILNDALRTGRFKARASGAFAEDAAIVQWDMDARADGKLKIAEDFHSDITDAALYAFRHSYAHFEGPAPLPPADEGEAHIRRLMAEQIQQQREDYGD